MSGGSLIYLGKHGTIKIDQKGRPKLYQWPTINENKASAKQQENYGPVTIRIEGEANNYDKHYQQKSESQGFHYSFKPSNNVLPPSMTVQRGTRIPVEVAGAPTKFKKHGDMLVMPIQHTSTINIEDVMQKHLQQQQQQYLQQQIQQLSLLQQNQQKSHQQQEQTIQEDPVAPSPPPVPVKEKRLDGNHGDDKRSHKSLGCANSDERNVYSELQSQILRRELSSDGNDEDESDYSYGTLSESLDSEHEAVPIRVAVLASVDTVVIVQANCGTDTTCDSPLLFDKLAEIAKACLAYFRKLSSDKMALNCTALGHIKLADQRAVSDHMEDLQNGMSDSILVTAVGRKASLKKFVGTFINDPCPGGMRGPVSIGKTGVIVVLQGLNRLAPLKEFSDQLCHHTALFKPTDMGQSGIARPPQMRMRESRAKSVGLLEQSFLYDNTITVWEASRRAFIDILDYTVLG